MIKVFLISLFVLITFTLSEAEDLFTTDEAGKLQGHLQNVSLAEIRSFFEKKYGIIFIGDDNIFNSQVTLSFSGLALEKTLKRVFSKMNVVFMFNSQGKIIEVRVFPSNRNQTPSLIANNLMKREDLLPNEATEVDQKDDITSFQIEVNSPPPGDPSPNEATEVDQKDDMTSFQVEVNSPPSGDTFLIVPSGPPSYE